MRCFCNSFLVSHVKYCRSHSSPSTVECFWPSQPLETNLKGATGFVVDHAIAFKAKRESRFLPPLFSKTLHSIRQCKFFACNHHVSFGFRQGAHSCSSASRSVDVSKTITLTDTFSTSLCSFLLLQLIGLAFTCAPSRRLQKERALKAEARDFTGCIALEFGARAVFFRYSHTVR